MNSLTAWFSNFIAWLECHEKLAGWAQFFGAMLAIAITYLTAFVPVWRRKRQLKKAARRLLSDGYNVIESYHRTSANFLPFPLSLRQAASSMIIVADEMNRFPIFELEDQGSRSIARYLVATRSALNGLRMFLEKVASDIEGRDTTKEDQEMIREFVGQQMEFLRNMLSGTEIKRPKWPPADE